MGYFVIPHAERGGYFSMMQTLLRLDTRSILVAAFCAAMMLASPATRAASPNIILFIGDDISWNDFGCYGNTAARTPRIDALAAGGIRFTNAYLTASSCSPSRASIVTGRYPHNTGKASELHRPMAWNLPRFPSLLRKAGYHTALAGKDHMSQEKPPKGVSLDLPPPFKVTEGGRVKGNNGGHGKWAQFVRDRPRDQPFFFWFASYDAHRAWDGDEEWDDSRYGPMHRPEDVIVPPFLADDPETRRDLASYYNEVTRYDHFIGKVVDELTTQDVLDDTLIVVMADNGRPFPRAKTRLHDSGMRTALVAHWPKGIGESGIRCDAIVSAIDLAPTFLEIAGAPIPQAIQGISMLPLFASPNASIRRYAFSEHNWHDYEAHGRAVRTGEFLYIRNSRPQFSWQGPADSVNSPSHESLRKLRDAANLTEAQADVFLAPRPVEELYKIGADPHQLDNLAGNPEYGDVKNRLSKLLDQWAEETGDSVPDNLRGDYFDRETGGQTGTKEGFERAITTAPGEDRGASAINRRGPY